MLLLIGGGILFIVFGIGMLVMPNSTRTLDRFDTHLRGGNPRVGNRVVRSLVLIAVGVVMLLIPILIFGQLD